MDEQIFGPDLSKVEAPSSSSSRTASGGLEAEPELRENNLSPSATGSSKVFVPFDLNASAPWTDLYYLIFYPQRFFKSLAGEAKISRWLIFKAMIGAVVFNWITKIIYGARQFKESLNQIATMNWKPGSFSMLESKLGVNDLKSKLLTGLSYFFQSTVFLSPIFTFVKILLWTSVTLAFLPLFGVDRRKIHFFPLFLAACFIEWLQPIAIIPYLGAVVASIWIWMLSIYAVKWIYEISVFKALLATNILKIFGFVFIFILALIAIVFFSALLGAAFR